SVNINETSNYWDQLAPFGGAGKSGVGRELSQWFLESFTERKLLVFELGDSELKYDRRAEGGWEPHPRLRPPRPRTPRRDRRSRRRPRRCGPPRRSGRATTPIPRPRGSP